MVFYFTAANLYSIFFSISLENFSCFSHFCLPLAQNILYFLLRYFPFFVIMTIRGSVPFSVQRGLKPSLLSLRGSTLLKTRYFAYFRFIWYFMKGIWYGWMPICLFQTGSFFVLAGFHMLRRLSIS